MGRDLMGSRDLLGGTSSGEEESSLDAIFTWQCAVLFAIFVLITLIWEFGTALLSFITVYFSGRKALWLQRLKAEVLALGIITLVLTAATPSLIKICIDGEPHGHQDVECPEGKAQLFTAHMIHETHLLLFETAIMHIVVTCSSFYLCLFRMRFWKKWEKIARDGSSPLDVGSDDLMKKLRGAGWSHALYSILSTVVNGVSENLYNLMRILFRVRIDSAVTNEKDKLPRMFNFLNLVEQAMEVEFSETSEHAAVLFLFMAVFLVIPRDARGIYFLSLMSVITTLMVSAKLQSIAVQLSASAYFDFQPEVEKAVEARAMHIRSRHSVSMKSPKSLTVRSLKLNGNHAVGEGTAPPSAPVAEGTERGDAGKPQAAYGDLPPVQDRRSLSGAMVPAPPVLPDGPTRASAALGAAPAAAAPGNTAAAVPGPAAPAAQAAGASSSSHTAPLPHEAPRQHAARTSVESQGVHVHAKSNQVVPLDVAMSRGSATGYASPLATPNAAAACVAFKPEHERFRSRVKVHFRDPALPNGQLRKECYDLYWFKSPNFLLWVFQLSFMETSLAMTLLFYGLWRDGSSFLKAEGPGLVAACIVVDIAVLVYASVNVLPVHALVNTVGTGDPAKLIKEIKRQKLVDEEDFEQGLGGKMLKCCFRGAESDDEMEDDTAHNSFIMMLADQAGVIGAGNVHSKGRGPQLHKLYVEVGKVWLQRTVDHQEGRGDVEYTIACDLSTMRKAFDSIDKNHSGTISSQELAAVLKALGTRATAEELEDMVNEIDMDGTDNIEFREFCLFLVFRFYDADNDGFVTSSDLTSTLQKCELDVTTHKAEFMMDQALDLRHDKRDKRRRIHLAEFIHLFTNVSLEHAPDEAPAQLQIEARQGPPGQQQGEHTTAATAAAGHHQH